jgi:thiamine pyrophosphate-dependent acetolactate synthase large subunit-like protein
MTMRLRDALEVLARHRGNHVVITTMSPIGVWPGLSDTPLDFAYIPSAMGHAPDFGLGIALAQPRHGVVVVNGDGCMLMNLGCLVTLASYPANVYLLIFDNGQYEVTGGQLTVGSGRIDFAGLARAAGIKRVYAFESLEQWKAGAAEALSGPGPVVASLKIEAKSGQKTPKAPHPIVEQVDRLRRALQT